MRGLRTLPPPTHFRHDTSGVDLPKLIFGVFLPVEGVPLPSPDGVFLPADGVTLLPPETGVFLPPVDNFEEEAFLG